MARTKTPAGLIENGRKRRQACAGRRRGLLQKAEQLATLCAVPVAVVVCAADPRGGAASPTVMETEAGVLGRYRVLPPDRRSKEHTHLRYLQRLLAKENFKLARVRPEALEPPHMEMRRVTLEELHALRKAVDATMAATVERRRALGLPADDDAVVVPCGPWTAGSSERDGYLHPLQQQGQGLLDQPIIWQGLQAHGSGMIQPPGHYGYHPEMNMPMQFNDGNNAVHMGGYRQEMPSKGGYYLEGLAPVPMGTSSSWMQAPSSGYFNNAATVHDPAIWSPTESSNTIAGYTYMNTSARAGEYPDQFTGNNSRDATPEFHNIGVGGNGMNYMGGYETTQGSSIDLQHSACQNSSSVKELFWDGYAISPTQMSSIVISPAIFDGGRPPA